MARRLLARMHAYSRRSRREAVQPATAQDFMRFLLRWHHVAPGTQVAGEPGLWAVLGQLQGFEAASVGWEPELLTRRIRHYDPMWLDGLCHAGDVAWLRLTSRSRDDADAPAAAPSKATPISVVLRADLPWLLTTARLDAGPAEPTVGATAEVLEVLRERGACFAAELAMATRRLPDDIERGLWDGVARGLIMCDGFAAVRARVGGAQATVASAGVGAGARAGRVGVGAGGGMGGRRGAGARGRQRPTRAGLSPRSGRLGRTPVAARTTAASAGRWSVVPPAETDVDRDELAEAVAEQLLTRWGVLFRDLAVRDSLRLPWRDLQWALRRLEDRGLVRGGRFVSGFSGEQYALPAAAEQLAHVRKQPRHGERVTLNATDPLNLVGVIVPGATVPAVRTNHVTYIDGIPASPGHSR